MLFNWILRTRLIVVTNHQLDLPVVLETCARLEIILLNDMIAQIQGNYRILREVSLPA